MDEAPRGNSIVTCGLSVLFAFICVACIAASAGGYLYVSRGTEPSDETSAAAGDGTLSGTPGITGTVQGGEIIINTPTRRPTSTPVPTATSAPVRISDTDSTNYAALLTFEGAIYVLEYIVTEIETNDIQETEAADYMLAVDRVFNTLDAPFSEPLPPETSPAMVQAWAEAVSAFSAIRQLPLIWQRGDVTLEEVKSTLIQVRQRLETSINMTDAALEEEYGIPLAQIRPQRTEEVRTEVLTSVVAFVETQQKETNPGSVSSISIEFSDKDIPLSDTLFSSRAWTYAGRIVQLSQNFSDAVTTLDELIKQDAQPMAGNRNQEIAFTIATIQASSRIIKETELPARMSSTRDLLLTALHDCDTAALYLRSGLTTPANYAIGQKYLETCNEKLVQPLAELNAFIANNQTPEELAVSSQETVYTCPTGCTEILPGCIIKGDIDSLGGKVYYLPGHSQYGAVTIEPDNNERWFCTVNEAISNGWQLPVNR